MGRDSQGRWITPPESRAAAGVTSAARTATGTGSEFNTDGAKQLDATLAITARSGTTPTLDVTLETTVDGTNWYTAGSFAQKNNTGSDAKAFGPLGSKCRWKWTIAGTTPSFTFSIATVAHR